MSDKLQRTESGVNRFGTLLESLHRLAERPFELIAAIVGVFTWISVVTTSVIRYLKGASALELIYLGAVLTLAAMLVLFVSKLLQTREEVRTLTNELNAIRVPLQIPAPSKVWLRARNAILEYFVEDKEGFKLLEESLPALKQERERAHDQWERTNAIDRKKRLDERMSKEAWIELQMDYLRKDAELSEAERTRDEILEAGATKLRQSLHDGQYFAQGYSSDQLLPFELMDISKPQWDYLRFNLGDGSAGGRGIIYHHVEVAKV